MTKGEARELMLRWLDEATINGQPVSQELIGDLVNKFKYFLNSAVSYIAGQIKLPRIYSVTRTPINNLLGTGFAEWSILPGEKHLAQAPGGRSYYFELSGNCNAEIWQGAQLVKTIAHTDNAYMAYKGILPNTADTRIEISSDYPFSVKNIALFGAPFPADEDVPDYTPFVAYTMPPDFREFDKIIGLGGGYHILNSDEYIWERENLFRLPYQSSGQFDFHYFATPKRIEVEAPDDTVIEVVEKAEMLVPLKVAIDITAGTDDLAGTSHYLDGKFSNMLVNIMGDGIPRDNPIRSVYAQ